MKVYIEYGWPEGKWHAKLLAESLITAGFEVVDEPAEADVIIAHSGGCYMLPSDITPKLVLHIGLPNWPGRIVPTSTLLKWNMETKNFYWFKKLFYQGVYFFNPITTYKSWRAWTKKILFNYPSAKTILIRNNKDTYMHDETSRALATKREWQYIESPGMHDDLWENPEQYVELIAQQRIKRNQ